ncbi:MAG: hypothetical protein AAGH19_06590 [Pseudomonadota bacterium]
MSTSTTTRSPGRWHVVSRIFAAAIPGYALANAASVLLGLLTPFSKTDSVVTAALASFAIYTGIIMWVFTVRRLATVWLGLLGALVVTTGSAWLLLGLEGSL